jgi:general secretion pathway protein G
MRLSLAVRQAAHSSRRAFTLLEILVVVAIIVMLAGLGGYYIMHRYEEAKVSTAKIECKKLAECAETYKMNNDGYPPSVESMAQQQPNGGAPFFPPEKAFDPWKKPYQIDTSSGIAVVFTTGPNGQQISSLDTK